MTISIILKSKIIAGVPDRWARQYDGYVDNGEKSKITRSLFELRDKGKLTEESVNAAIGNCSWTSNKCDECGGDFDVLIRIGQEPDYDARFLDLCGNCIRKASDLEAAE